MAEIDLYGDQDVEDFQQAEDFGGDGIDLYDDVIAAPTTDIPRVNDVVIPSQIDRVEPTENTNGYHNQGNMGHVARRHQLYVGNLSWWTTDQDITDSMAEVGCSDFQEVKFFENRVNGQSKGFCVVSLGSEGSMRLVMERLPKKEIHGQNPVVTLPTKQALNQFESQQKTRPIPAPTTGGPPFVPRGPAPGGHPGQGHPGQGPPPGHQPRMMNPNGPPMRPGPPGHMQMQNMPPQGPPGQPMQRMQGPPMHQGGGPMQQGPPRYPNQQWNGMRPNGPPRPGPPQGPGGQRPPMYQGGPPMRGPRPDWNRPPMHQGNFQQGGPPPQGPPMMQGPPRGPVPPQMGGPPIPHGGGPPQGVAPHVNPAFFPGGAPPQQHPGIQAPGPPHGGPPQQSVPPHFSQQNPPRGPWPPGPGLPQGKPIGPPFPEQGPPQQQPPQISEVEFEEIMARNRTVSSSAIARAVSDAAAGEYSSAIETLVTAISLIKQSKVAHDERCKILISSLQDTLHGIENKSYSSRGRERSRSRDRSHRRARRERSSSRYRERSRDRKGSRDKDRERDGRYYGSTGDSYREPREARDNRSRSRERERGGGSAAVSSEHYRAESSGRTRPRNKSPEVVAEPATETSKRSYYDDRYRSSDRDRERDRDRESRREEHRSRH